MNEPWPGSPRAVRAGCTCPVLDNARGLGAQGTHDLPDEDKWWNISGDCPLHGPKEDDDDAENFQR